MRSVVICGGVLETEFILEKIASFSPDQIIAMEKGVRFCMDNGLRVDCAVGDFDTIGDEIIPLLEKNGTEVLRYPSEKDETDSEIAVRKACETGSDIICILGATGGRLDHFMANISLLEYAKRCSGGSVSDVFIADSKNEIRLYEGKHVLKKSYVNNRYVSFIRFFGDPVITLCGFRYDVAGYRMTSDNPSRCISNMIDDEEAYAEVRDGKVLMILASD
ncbi:MAG: thiamine diphosphokinase [Lachnospiraceae bacterium]|jgi:thiamine pyrophosphokinase